ncbi:MAG: hypothetical protein IPF46_17755 [Saprospiraceae bacterium]|nr:hypothetical protein [Candidatus Vicinibacter affinis]
MYRLLGPPGLISGSAINSVLLLRAITAILFKDGCDNHQYALGVRAISDAKLKIPTRMEFR